jgi:RimJ/RimL family protein N-acetyltransferase
LNFSKISEINDSNRTLMKKFISDSWGSPLSVSKGRILDTTNLPGFICKENNKIVGLVTYFIDGTDCEIVTLNSSMNNKGLETILINKVMDKAKANHCKRVWLITTNDNTNAIRYYQRRGFEWVGFYKNAMEESRRLKPEIPKFGNNNIPIKQEYVCVQVFYEIYSKKRHNQIFTT